MADYREALVGIDVAKLKKAIAVAESGWGGEVRYFGEVKSDASMRRIIQRITAKFDHVHFCYEAGPTGYGLHRLIQSLGHECMVVAPSLIPRKPGDRVKTNRRNALALAPLLRAGELTAVWVPDESHEAMCDLVRARAAAVETLRVHRQQISAFTLKHSRIYTELAVGAYGRRAADDAFDGVLTASSLAIADTVGIEEGAVAVDIPYPAFVILGASRLNRVFYRVKAPGGSFATGSLILALDIPLAQDESATAAFHI